MSSDAPAAVSKRPYLVRAMHEWMSDSGHTPHIVVDATMAGVNVPEQHAKDGRIILNISYSAAHDLRLDNEAVSFRARFGGTPYDVWVPVTAILGIYARETGQGMIFSQNDDGPEPPDGPGGDGGNDDDKGDDGGRSGRPSHLKVVK
ncbi:ClpXP protease specificity-enhancing factor [Lentisalinibacter salinarum]|uniref:ClpXP protease specificity-enhancing factor n=1 Tax=Lentisalinibacter salinarum TaxID=2992239 RepID=UPI00386C51AD